MAKTKAITKTIDDARQEGKDAYSEDKELKDNPYSADTKEAGLHRAWAEAWNRAKKNDPLSDENMTW